jgi:hypothetical protein
MRLGQLIALSFVDETNKIASAIGVPINQLSLADATELVEDFFEKDAATRAVKEWQKAHAAGDTGTADSIAKGYGDLNLKPRQLRDVSIGGAEAGVDQMMGDVRHSTGQMPQNEQMSPRRELFGRLDQMKANKADLGLEGRSPTQSVKSSPEGRAALLRGTQPAAGPGPAPNESGYVARKMYKPDSYISQAEFTPQHVQQKMDMTQAARSLSPEAKAMVPDMYGMKTMGAGPTQRTMSYHEYVPGMQDMRGKNIGTEDKPIYSQQQQASKDLSAVNQHVLGPLSGKGMIMGDVTGSRGTNWGNVARDASGQAKIVDFLPQMAGQRSPAAQSFAKYAPGATLRHSEEGGGTVGDLRKEMYKPTMQSRPATPQQLQMALREHGLDAKTPAPTPQPDPFKQPAATSAPVSGVAKTSPAPASGFARTSMSPPAMQPAATSAAAPAARRASPAMQPAATSPAAPQARPAAPAARPATPAPAMQPMRTGAASPGALRPPARRPAAPSFHLPTKPVLGGLHR